MLEAVIEKARAGDGEARKELVDRAGLRIARVAMGDSAKDKFDALREIERGEGRSAPGLGVLLAGIARERDDGELRRALELVLRAGSRRWGPPERLAIGGCVAAHGARLTPELALDILEWAAGFPDSIDDVVRGVAPVLASAHAEQLERFGWHRGFAAFVMTDRAHVVAWSAQPVIAAQIARALFRVEHGRVAVIETLWEQAPDRDVWATALAKEVRGTRSGIDDLVDWSWERFCTHAGERRALYRAFEAWRDLWIERRNKMSARERPGGASAIAHLELWGGLDIEHLSAVVEELKRLARDDEWARLVDVTFDLAIGAPHELRRHALAGTCRIASEVANRIRAGAASLDAAGDRVIARGEALARELRESGAVIDEIVANRADDLELEARLIREHRARNAAREAEQREREQQQRDRERARAEAEAARRAAEIEAQQRAAAMKITVEAQVRPTQPIDEEIFFSSLPAPSLIAYARLFKRLTQADGMQSLAADGVTMEMVTVINQTWASLFAQRPDLAMRFSMLISC